MSKIRPHVRCIKHACIYCRRNGDLRAWAILYRICNALMSGRSDKFLIKELKRAELI